MRVRAILNRDGGTLKTTDLEAYERHLESVFAGTGHQIDVRIVSGNELLGALKAAAGDDALDAIVAGGGDGTISAAAAAAWKGGKALGVLPAGTMNLFARSLGMPLDITEAATALARGAVIHADISTAGNRAFVHQFSVGMHSRLVVARNKADYSSRFGKIAAGCRAALAVLVRPPAFAVRMTIDGEPTGSSQASFIAVTNNPYGEGHLPYADGVDSGVLGIYYAPPLDTIAAMRFAARVAAGAWRANPDLTAGRGHEVVLEFPRLKRSARAVIDGEVVKLEAQVTVRIHAGALKVILPAATPET